MAHTPRGKAFDDNEPTIAQQEIRDAFKADRIVLSFKGQPVLRNDKTIEFLVIKLALANGSHETVLVDRFSAEALMALLEAAKSVNWDGKTFDTGPTQH